MARSECRTLELKAHLRVGARRPQPQAPDLFLGSRRDVNLIPLTAQAEQPSVMSF